MIIKKAEARQWDTYLSTHRVALDWLSDRINLDPVIQVNYVDTQSQLAEVLPKGTFTRDHRDRLLRLFNIVAASLFSRSHSSFRIDEFSAISKRQMHAKEEGAKTHVELIE